MRQLICRDGHKQQGYALLTVLILMLVGSIVIAPLLSFMSTGINTTSTYVNKTREVYAADAGIEDGKWQVKYDKLTATFATHTPPYDAYDYYTANWTYGLDQTVNNHPVSVNVKNVWIPTDAAPSKADAATIIEGAGGQAPRLAMSGTVTVPPTTGNNTGVYAITITFYPASPGDDFTVTGLSIWLPLNSLYVAGSSNLESADVPLPPYHCVPADPVDYYGGQKVVWTFAPALNFTSFPGSATSGLVDDTRSPMKSTITFQYTGAPNHRPAAVSWMDTSLDLSGSPNHLNYVWDADKRVFKITSTAGTTVIESHLVRLETRSLASAREGDYYATGNSLLTWDNNYGHHYYSNWNSNSLASVGPSNVPDDADVSAAYLYWSSWKNESRKTYPAPLNPDQCSNYTNWTRSGTNPYTNTSWGLPGSSSYFAARSNSWDADDSAGRLLTLRNSINLSAYASAPWVVAITWDQWVSYSSAVPGPDDGLDFDLWNPTTSRWDRFTAFRGTSPGTVQGYPTAVFRYMIPSTYLTANFLIRYHLAGFFGSNQYVYVDNIRLQAMQPNTGVQFFIGNTQVSFDPATGAPRTGPHDLVSTKNQVLPTLLGSTPFGFSYSCFRDVTDLVKQYAEQPAPGMTNFTGHATYRVNDIQAEMVDVLDHNGTRSEAAYAGWSLIIIYTSPATKGHQLYLYDKFVFSNQNYTTSPYGVNVDFDEDGRPGGAISGFYVPEPARDQNGNVTETTAATITAFVGEGDYWYSGDYIALHRPEDPQGANKLWDGVTLAPPPVSGSNPAAEPYKPNNSGTPENVWTGQSVGLSAGGGVDIDTFTVPWGNPVSAGVLRPGDTSAQVDLFTIVDGWNMVYIIFSFRSATTYGGSLSFLIVN